MGRSALLLIVALLLVGTTAAADTLTIPDTGPHANLQKNVPVLLSSATGLSSYNITFTIDNGTVARIEDVTFPAWATTHNSTATPGTLITIDAADTGNAVPAPTDGALLATLTVKALAIGTTNLSVTAYQIDDDAGGTVTPTITNSTITVAGTARPRASETIPTLSEAISDRLTGSLGGEEQPAAGEESIDWVGILAAAYDAYETPLGPLAAVLIFALPFLMMWIAQRDMTLPGIVGALLGLFIIVRLPANFHVLAVTFITISVVAVIYSLVKERV